MTTSAEISATEPAQAVQPVVSNTPSIKLKASLAPMTALELTDFSPQQFEEELAAKVSQAPGFFENLPVLIDLENYQQTNLDFESLLEICEKHSVKAIGVRGADAALQEQAKRVGLSNLAAQKERPAAQERQESKAASSSDSEPDDKPADAETTTQAPTPEPVVQTKTQVSKVVHHPIRSGQQVYAADGDLIVLASVSAGAEILADGNIHVYGTLRGRALAGVKGNTSARIFCHSMAAELASIAGQYKISEDLPSSVIGKACQVYLEDKALKFKRLDF